jgi:O-methyltransferase / aklanonic acid methyltransferase
MTDPDTTARLVATFGNVASTYDTAIPYFATFGRWLVDVARASPGEMVVDVAAGRGASTIPAAEAVGPRGRVLGIDLAGEMVAALGEEIRRRRITNASAERMDAEKLDLADASCDLVLCGFMLHLLPDPSAVVAEFRRVLRSGGRCAVSVPLAGRGTASLLHDVMARYVSGTPTSSLVMSTRTPAGPPRDIGRLLRHAGFDNVTVIDRSATFCVPSPDAWWRWASSTGIDLLFETVPTEMREEARAAAHDHVSRAIGSGGLSLEQSVRFATGSIP